MFPREIYKDGQYLVVWGMEEHRSFLAQGWTDEKPEPEFISPLHEIAEALKDGTFPKRRGRPPNVRPISEVA